MIYDAVLVGSGFSAIATLCNLIELLPVTATVAVIGDDPGFGRGTAYRSELYLHRLNVPAGRMSLFPDRPDGFVEWLAERSRGNSLFALSLLQALLDEGADLSAPALRSLPEALTEHVAVRIRNLDEPAIATLESLAAIGRRVDFRDLVALIGLPADRLALILERLVRSRLVSEQEHGHELTYELAHPLIQEAIYERIGAARRRGFRVDAAGCRRQGHRE